MGTVSFYEFAYLLSHSMGAGGSFTVVFDTLFACLWPFVILVVIYVLLNKYLLKKNITKLTFSIIILVISLLCLVRAVKLDEYIINKCKNTDIYEKYYVDTNSVNVTLPKNKRNLIIIYLESMESSLFSKDNGGAFDKSIIPELESIALNNINFSNTNLLGGAYTLTSTSFTISSITASTTGTPVNIKLFDGYTKEKPFMKNVKSLGNILSDNGYNLELIQGSEKEFGALDLYSIDNGNYKIFDNNTAKEKGLIDKDYFEWWGLEDKKVLEFSKEELKELSKEDKPFMLMLFTMDTHFKDGYQDDTCDKPYKEPLANSYACSSKMVNEYLNWLKEQDFYNNTTIVLMGDHQVMQDSFYKDHKDYQRVNYNAFINSVKNTNTKNREFSQYDMYPTILSSIGANIPGNKLGFGVDLFSGEKTLIEEIGKEEFDKELLKSSEYYDKYIFIK
jgi:phosphoglycerol transferase